VLDSSGMMYYYSHKVGGTWPRGRGGEGECGAGGGGYEI